MSSDIVENGGEIHEKVLDIPPDTSTASTTTDSSPLIVNNQITNVETLGITSSSNPLPSKASGVIPKIPEPDLVEMQEITLHTYPDNVSSLQFTNGSMYPTENGVDLTEIPTIKLYLAEDEFNTLKRRHGTRVKVRKRGEFTGRSTLSPLTDSDTAMEGVIPANIFDEASRGFWYDHRDVNANTWAQDAITKHSLSIGRDSMQMSIDGIPSFPHLNYDVSFRHMLWRRLQRTKYGNYRPSKRSRIAWFLLIFTLFLIFVFTLLFRIWGENILDVLYKNLSALIVFIILIPITGSAFVNASGTFSRLMLFWILLGSVVFFVVDLFLIVDSNDDWFASPNSKAVAISITVVVLFLELITFIAYICYFYIYPKLLLTGVFRGHTAEHLFRIKPDPDPRHLWLYSYFSLDDDLAYTCCKRKASQTFQYAGEVNEWLQPHGFGEWRDDSTLGETLSGYWENGIPRAPFISRELSTLNMFASLRLLYARNNKAGWKDSSSRPARESEELSWGVAEVECSVAGSFNRYLPRAALLIEPTLKSVDLDIVKTCLDSVSFGASTIEDEVVICIHGFYASMEWGLKNFAQVAALGNLSSQTKIVIFDWPGGNPFSFAKAREFSKSEGVRRDLVALVTELTKHGVKKFNFMGHSMGSRVTLLLVEVLASLFQPLEGSGMVIDSKLPKLCSVTLINAEMEMDTWMNSKYPVLRKYCSLITLYADQNDVALWGAELWMGRDRQVVGLNPRSQYVLFDETEEGGTLRRSKKTDKADLKSKSAKRYLDVDVVDTTALDSNVHFLRHGYFVLNRLVIDDIAEIVLSKKRAKQRTRLLRREGNLFAFLVAPAFVEN